MSNNPREVSHGTIMNQQSVSGSCLCGQVAFDIQLPTKWCAHCHCSICQRAHGAAFVTWVGVDEQSFHYSSGRKSVRWFGSSEKAERGFCDDCGTTLFFKSSRWPGEIHLVRTAIAGPLDREPRAHVFYESHADWLQIADDLPKEN